VATGKVQSVCVTRSECSKQAAGNIECARGEVVLTCECVLCVGNYITTTTTAETTICLLCVTTSASQMKLLPAPYSIHGKQTSIN